jgi:broad specificity phosphatase PhoE
VLPNQPFLSDARLREVSKGARQGFPKSWTYEQALEARKANGQDIPLLETAQDTWERIFSWMYEVMVQSEKEETISNNADASEEEEEEDVRKVLVISHAGTLRLLLHHLVPDGHAALKMADDPSRPPDDDSQRFAVPNTSLTILEVALREDAPTQQQKTSGDDDDIHTPNNMEPPPVPPEEHQRLWTTRLVELTWTGHYESIIR